MVVTVGVVPVDVSHADEALMSLLWQASAGLLGIVVLSASSVVFKTWTDSRRRSQAKSHRRADA